MVETLRPFWGSVLGSEGQCCVQLSCCPQRRGVISFDVAAVVPAGATINSATLRLYLSRVNTSSAANISIYKASATWGEGTSYYNGGLCADSTTDDATWIHRSYNDLTSPWQAAAGDFAAMASQSMRVGTTLQYYEWISNSAMVADVQDWLDTPGANAGWVVVNDAPVAGDARRFRSREQITNKPELVIDYTPR